MPYHSEYAMRSTMLVASARTRPAAPAARMSSTHSSRCRAEKRTSMALARRREPGSITACTKDSVIPAAAAAVDRGKVMPAAAAAAAAVDRG